MSSEHRVVRPYAGVDEVQDLLATVHLEFGERVLEDGQRVNASPIQYLTEPLTLSLATDDDLHHQFRQDLTEAVEGMKLDCADVEMVAVLESARLKISDIVWRASVKDLNSHGRRIALARATDRPRALQAPFGGCRAKLYVVLANENPPSPLRPFRKGTWLARCTYVISTDLGEIGFTPQELTDEIREQYGLLPDTLRFVVVESPLDENAGDDAVTVYVDTDVLARLNANTMTPGSQLIQRQLFLDAMTTAIYVASKELETTPVSYGDARESLLGRLIGRMSQSGSDVDEELAARHWRMAQKDPHLLVARLEGWMPGFRKALLDSVGLDER